MSVFVGFLMKNRYLNLKKFFLFFKRQSDLFRALEYNAAVKIQSWYRGVRVRSYLKYLHEKATLVQKIWRGHFGRKIYRHVLSVS